jgi:hypothetical protein
MMLREQNLTFRRIDRDLGRMAGDNIGGFR